MPGALLLLVTLLLYAPVRRHQFLEYDDSQYITTNSHVLTGLNAENVKWAFTTFREANWHPLTWISHMIDCELFGLKPGPHHVVNLALHLANVLILFLLLQRATGSLWSSLFVAALFAVHPQNVETVAWAAQRKSLLSAFFSLLTIAAYAWYAQRPARRRYLSVMAMFALALLSKPMAVSLPLVLMLLDYWPLRRYADRPVRHWVAQSLWEKLPLFLMSAAGSVVTMAAQKAGGAIADTSALTLAVRLQNAVISYVSYIGKMLWPAKLAVLYPHPEQALPWSVVLAAAVILGVITAAVLYLRLAPFLSVGWMLFIITMIPVIGIVQVGRQAMADRYTYIPHIGLFIAIAWGAGRVAKRSPALRSMSAMAALCLLALLAAATARYLSFWENGVKLFSHARTVIGKPDPILEETLADSLLKDGRINEAFRHYQRACELLPTYAHCHFNMAEILFSRNELQSALEQYQLAGKHTHSREMALSCLINSGKILLRLGNPDWAEMQFASALQIDPNNSTAFFLRQQAINQKLRHQPR